MEDEQQVDIDGTTYSLVKLPGRDTQLVRSERDRVLGGIDLKTLVVDLGRVGKFIRVAYNGVTAAGPKFTDLQIEIQDLGYDVTKLCDKSAVTVSKFKRTCGSILTTLQSTYEYLLSGYETMALMNLASVSKLAGDMASAAEELHKDFEQEAEKVKNVQQKAMRSKAEQATLVKDLQIQEGELKAKQKLQQEIVDNARKAEEEERTRFREYEMREDKAMQQLGEDGNIFTKVVNAVTSVFGITAFGECRETKERKFRHWQAKKVEALEKRIECERMRMDAYQQLIEFAVQIERCRDEKELAAAATSALHKAIGGLRDLSRVMLQASVFWKQLQVHCKALGEDDLKKVVAGAINDLDETKRRKFWTTPGFKRQAVNFYAGWVALDEICVEYVSAIQETRKDLYKYITENPSYEEAGTNIHQLAAEFQHDLREGQKAIQDRISKADEEKENVLSSQGE